MNKKNVHIINTSNNKSIYTHVYISYVCTHYMYIYLYINQEQNFNYNSALRILTIIILYNKSKMFFLFLNFLRIN